VHVAPGAADAILMTLREADMSTTSGLAVTCPRPGQYTLRVTGSRPIATEAAFEALCARLLADGDPDETVVLTFTGDVGI
jgi:hypothetical protein